MVDRGAMTTDQLTSEVTMFSRNVDVEVFSTSSNPLPTYAHIGDAGADLYLSENTKVYPGETRTLKTGLYVAIPEGFEIQIRPRSGMSAKTKLRVANAPGTIDHQYRGEIMVLMDNVGDTPVELNIGDRIAQMIIAPVWNVVWRQVDTKDDLGTTTRGSGGFGSTGT